MALDIETLTRVFSTTFTRALRESLQEALEECQVQCWEKEKLQRRAHRFGQYHYYSSRLDRDLPTSRQDAPEDAIGDIMKEVSGDLTKDDLDRDIDEYMAKQCKKCGCTR